MIPDLTKIVDKLKEHGLVEHYPTGMRGEFSLKKHSHIFTAEELEFFLKILHQSSAPHDQDCHDLHRWNFQYMEEN